MFSFSFSPLKFDFDTSKSWYNQKKKEQGIVDVFSEKYDAYISMVYEIEIIITWQNLDIVFIHEFCIIVQASKSSSELTV